MKWVVFFMSFYGKIPKRSELGTVSLNSILNGLDMFFLMYLRKHMSANALIKICQSLFQSFVNFSTLF